MQYIFLLSFYFYYTCIDIALTFLSINNFYNLNQKQSCYGHKTEKNIALIVTNWAS